MSPVIALFIDIGSDIGAVTIDQCDDICLALIWEGDVWAVTAVTEAKTLGAGPSWVSCTLRAAERLVHVKLARRGGSRLLGMCLVIS